MSTTLIRVEIPIVFLNLAIPICNFIFFYFIYIFFLEPLLQARFECQECEEEKEEVVDVFLGKRILRKRQWWWPVGAMSGWKVFV